MKLLRVSDCVIYMSYRNEIFAICYEKTARGIRQVTRVAKQREDKMIEPYPRIMGDFEHHTCDEESK